MTAEGEAGAGAAPEAGPTHADPHAAAGDGDPPGTDPAASAPGEDAAEGGPPGAEPAASAPGEDAADGGPPDAEPGDDGLPGAEPGDDGLPGAEPGEGGLPGAEPGDDGLPGAEPGEGGLPGADAPAADAAARVADGIAHLEQAIAAFADAAESADSDVVPLAVELLARTLPLCERDEDSAWTWQHGLEHPDPAVAVAVRQRLRRAFGSDEESWWEGFVESAVCHSTLPLLANEVFGALDHMYALAAVPLARGGARTRELRDVLAQAVRVPAGYAWGGELLASFRARFRDITGSDTEAFPADWPAG
jgi:hypothetical protein